MVKKDCRRDAGYLFLIALGGVLLFLPSLPFEFLSGWDDAAYVSAAFQGWGRWWRNPLEGLWTPLVAHSLALDARVWGGALPWHFRLTNLVLHILNCMLFYGLGRRMRVPAGIMAGAALLWGLHVQRVESVVWIAERKDVLSAFFVLCAWHCTMMRNRAAGSAGAACSGILAVLAKPAMAGVAVWIALAGFLRGGKGWKTAFAGILPAMCCVCAALPAWLMAQGSVPPQGAWTHRAQVIGHNVFWYWGSAFFPVHACPVYPLGESGLSDVFPAVAAGGMILAAMIALYGKNLWKKKAREYGFLAAVWLAFFLPSCGWRVFSNADYADRYNYMPSLVVFLLLAWLGRDAAARNRKRLKILVPAGLICAALTGMRTAFYLPVWQDEEHLFAAAVRRYASPNPRAVEGLGRTGLYRNKPELLEEAGSVFLRMAEGADKEASPEGKHLAAAWRDTGTYYSGLAAYLRRDFDGAERCWKDLCRPGYRAVLYLEDVNAPVLYGGYADICLRRGEPGEAARLMRRQLRYLGQEEPEAFFVRGNIALLEGDAGSAERCYREVSARSCDAELRLRAEKLLKSLSSFPEQEKH